ncbi:MAG TPA: hypothetical protein VMW52_05340, partial [Phycisphaerae bacterium]|nr:hypothetical protein [Phycisphaerae bacterium]
VRMATERQRDLIAKLTGELGWTTSMLDRCCQFEVGLADGLAGVRTTVDAMHLIKVLIAHKWRRDRVDHTGSRRGAGPRSRG